MRTQTILALAVAAVAAAATAYLLTRSSTGAAAASAPGAASNSTASQAHQADLESISDSNGATGQRTAQATAPDAAQAESNALAAKQPGANANATQVQAVPKRKVLVQDTDLNAAVATSVEDTLAGESISFESKYDGYDAATLHSSFDALTAFLESQRHLKDKDKADALDADEIATMERELQWLKEYIANKKGG